ILPLSPTKKFSTSIFCYKEEQKNLQNSLTEGPFIDFQQVEKYAFFPKKHLVFLRFGTKKSRILPKFCSRWDKVEQFESKQNLRITSQTKRGFYYTIGFVIVLQNK